MNKEEIQTVSFQLISYAGEAFSTFYEAVEEARKGNFELAHKKMEEGEKLLNEGHKAQMNLLASEANGQDMELSVILIHAQDHLMTTIMYQRIAKQLIGILEEVRS